MMSANVDDLTAVVRYALETTRATAICPFHDDSIIRVGDIPPRAMLTNAPRASSAATGRPGREKLSGKRSVANLPFCPTRTMPKV